MSIDKDKIKDALDNFENDKFTDAKDAVQGEISRARDKFLKDKLDLKDFGTEKEDNTDDSGSEEEE